jgi:hypothetical protein
MPTILGGESVTQYFWYGIYFPLIVSFVTVVSPILIWIKLSRISLFGFIVILYLPFAYGLIYPALFISIACMAYGSIHSIPRQGWRNPEITININSIIYFEYIIIIFQASFVKALILRGLMVKPSKII